MQVAPSPGDARRVAAGGFGSELPRSDVFAPAGRFVADVVDASDARPNVSGALAAGALALGGGGVAAPALACALALGGGGVAASALAFSLGMRVAAAPFALAVEAALVSAALAALAALLHA
jgi:hypothetical protein